ncbi:hypothetical protein K2173_016473 [Erythroxylum novogranatense]|uniref:WD repeat-containing protein 44-like n=1 Tax=Erythroxylum novogranatense TaxID=1862640 RepID=A0AAV8SS19_9ROSI|nr:hypothetical protein K2173_016473 [Erythroxylum novogranatense]
MSRHYDSKKKMSKNGKKNKRNDNGHRQDHEQQQQEEEEEEEECFYESLDRIASSSCSCSTSNSDSDSDSDPDPNPTTCSNSGSASPTQHHHHVFKYDVWISEPASVSERRQRLLHQMGLSSDPSLSLGRTAGDVGSSSLRRLTGYDGVHRAYRNEGGDPYSDKFNSCSSSSSSLLSAVYSSPILSHDLMDVNTDKSNHKKTTANDGNACFHVGCKRINSTCSFSSWQNVTAVSPSKPPSGKYGKRVDVNRSDSSNSNENFNRNWSRTSLGELVDELACNGVETAAEVCTIKNLDNGKEFVVNEIREDGMWNKLKEVGTGRQLTMEEFEMTVGHSPIVQELMRRQNVEDGNTDNVNSSAHGSSGGGVSKLKKKGGWFKSIKGVASSVKGHKERRSSDEKDTGSEKGGRRSSSATDDSQDVSFHGPERVRVRQYGKSFKELSAVYKCQEIQAHNGSIWTIKFSLDGKYLASAGEDCVIHIWHVMEAERKGVLMENHNLLLMTNGSPEPTLLSPSVDGHVEKKRRGRPSISRKSLSLDHLVVPGTVFVLTDKPICSFHGHFDDVLDLSWSKSQCLLSSSMDKTVRLWHFSSQTCLKIFSHSDYVTCIQFNPVDDAYFISGSLDQKVRIWSIPDRQVVDWNDLHEMVTAACYTPDGQGALVGTYKGRCHLYNTSGNKLKQKCQINLQDRKKKAHLKKINGFQFVPGSSSEVLITSADSRIRVVDGIDLVHKFKGFSNSKSQISATLTANGKYVVAASADSYVYVWNHEADSQPNRSKGVTVTHSYEHFHCQDVSVAIPWPGMGETWGLDEHYSEEWFDSHLDEVSIANHPPTPVEEMSGNEDSRSVIGCTNNSVNGIISSATNGYFFDRISATWPEEKLNLATRTRSPRTSIDFSNQSMSAYGMVIVTAGLRGEIRTFQNFGFSSI